MLAIDSSDQGRLGIVLCSEEAETTLEVGPERVCVLRAPAPGLRYQYLLDQVDSYLDDLV